MRCYVCNASPYDDCQAIGGEVAECPRPTRAGAEFLMVSEARQALDCWMHQPAQREVHAANARRIAAALGLSARREVTA